MRRLIVSSCSAIVLFCALACEPSGSATAPSGVTGSATVSGSILNATTGSGSLRSTGATVQIPGSSVSTMVDENQSFTLTNVPPGSNVLLQFTGTGLNTQVPIGPVGTGEFVAVSFVRNENTIEVDHTGRRSADGKDVQGLIDSISGTSFVVIGQTIQTNSSTQFVQSTGQTASFTDLQLGSRVTVTGTPSFGGTLLATTVRLEGPEITVNLQGPISNLTGTSQSFQFNVEGRVVKGDSTTAFDAGVSFLNLTTGTPVSVTGIVRSNFVQATRIQLQ